MIHFNLQEAQYAVCGLQGFSLSDALRFWKAKFETIKHYQRDVIKHPGLKKLGMFVSEVWDEIRPITVQEALQEQNMEKRRVMFDCIGVSRLFNELSPALLDRQTIKKVRTRWDSNNKPYQYQYDDTYELYHIDGDKLFVAPDSGNKPNPVYAVRCWCTTTNREYWIYVPGEIAIGKLWWSSAEPDPDAIRAIAWTIRIDITNPKRIYRQGDIIIAVESDQSKQVEPYHLTKDQYLNLMFSES